MAPPVADPQLVITVTRSGGFAGLMRVWEVRVADGEPQADRWRAMVAPLATSSEADGVPDLPDEDAREHDDAGAGTDDVSGDVGDRTPPAEDRTPPAEDRTPAPDGPSPLTDDPAKLATPRAPRGADRFVWTIVVVDDPDRWTLRCTENDLTDDARTLIDAVRRDGSRPD